MKRNKRYFLKTNVENFLTTIVMLSIAFVAMTIDSIGNNTYNITLIIIIITNRAKVNEVIYFCNTVSSSSVPSGR